MKIRCALGIYLLKNEGIEEFLTPFAHWSMTVKQFLRSLQTGEAFIVAFIFTSEKWLMTIKKSLFRHWPLIMNFFAVYFSILVRCKTKGAGGVVCALLRICPFKCLIADYCIKWHGIYKGLSHDGGWEDFSKNPRASSFNKDLSNEPNFGRIHLAGQYL